MPAAEMAASAQLTSPTVGRRHRDQATLEAIVATLARLVDTQGATVALYEALLTMAEPDALDRPAPPRSLLERFWQEAREHQHMLIAALSAARARLDDGDRPSAPPSLAAEDLATTSQCIHALVSALVLSTDGLSEVSESAQRFGASHHAMAFARACSEQHQQWQTLAGWLCEPSLDGAQV